MDPQTQLELDWVQLERMIVPLRRDIREYAACWARVLSFFLPGLGHVFIGATGYGLVYFAMFSAAASAAYLNRHGVWWPGAVGIVAVWAVSLGHIHAQTKEN